MTKYNTTTLQVKRYDHCSEYLSDCSLEIDCEVRYSWWNNALNDVYIDIDSIRFQCLDGDFIDLSPIIADKALRALKQELRESFVSDFWIERAE